MTPEEKQKRETLYRAMVRLRNYEEWKIFEKEIDEVIAFHKQAALSFLSQNKDIDAKKQSWLVDGLEECITRPKFIVECEENSFEAIMARFKNRFLDKLSKRSG